MFRFERLDIWHKAADFAGSIYAATERFPGKERFGITSQIRRAAGSISANIAEGSSRASDKDFSRFIEIAYGSLCETVSYLRISQTQGFVTAEEANPICREADELGRMLSAFRNTLGRWKSLPDPEP